ncbi:hypothetical protein V8F20_012429 [Naviculisporaceae sp. PSN 640]
MLSQVLLGLCVASTALAAPLENRQTTTKKCVNPPVRKSWHSLSTSERQAYIDAELCLMSKPGTLGLRGGRTKFDEFQAVHVAQAEIAHFVGQFFPFHRLYVWAHEVALRKECGYTGGHPYWDETIDAGAFTKSILFTETPGFGGNGVRNGSLACIETGPFASYKNPIGPGYKLQDHCISRWISDLPTNGASKSTVDACMAKTTYLDFWECVEGPTGPHGAGHGGVGADMTNPVSSPGDPVFYMHHAWLDRLWAKWQAQNPEVRLKEIGGNNKPAASGFPFPGGGPGAGPPPGFGNGGPGGGAGGGGGGGEGGFPGFFPPFDPRDLIRPDDVPEPLVMGDEGANVTLTHMLEMYGTVPDQTVADVMDIQGDVLCYDYD